MIHKLINKDRINYMQCVNSSKYYKPLYANIKLVYHCNLRCVMCNHWKYKQKYFDEDLMYSLVDQLSDLGCKRIQLSGGESTLHPKLIAFISYIATKGIQTTLTTNGVLLTKVSYAKDLISAGLTYLIFSIDSPIKKVHDKIRGKNSWENVVNAIKTIRGISDISIDINTVVSNLNYNSFETFPQLLSELKISGIEFIPINVHTKPMRYLFKDEIIEFNKQMHKISLELNNQGIYCDNSFAFGETDSEISEALIGNYSLGYYDNNKCNAPHSLVHIDTHGNISVCGDLHNNPQLGNIFNMKLKDILYQRNEHIISLEKNKSIACNQCSCWLVKNKKINEAIYN